MKSISWLQALSTWTAADGIEACRRGCGGHGFSALSGLPDLYASYVQNVTLEGDNNVMSLQVGPLVLHRLHLSIGMDVACSGTAGS